MHGKSSWGDKDLTTKPWEINGRVQFCSARSLFGSAMQADGTVFLLDIDLRGNAHSLLEQKNGQMCWAIPSYDGKHLASVLMTGESNAWMLEDF